MQTIELFKLWNLYQKIMSVCCQFPKLHDIIQCLVFIMDQGKPAFNIWFKSCHNAGKSKTIFHIPNFVWLCIIFLVSYADKKDYKMSHVVSTMFTFHHRTLLLHVSRILTEKKIKQKTCYE